MNNDERLQDNILGCNFERSDFLQELFIRSNDLVYIYIFIYICYIVHRLGVTSMKEITQQNSSFNTGCYNNVRRHSVKGTIYRLTIQIRTSNYVAVFPFQCRILINFLWRTIIHRYTRTHTHERRERERSINIRNR